jgi:predicted PurR-regulated permease PerM
MNDNDRPITVTISSGTIFMAALIIVLFAGLYFLQDIALIILTSVVIASSVEPATRWFAKYRVSRVPAVLFTYIIFFALIIGIFYFFVPPLLDDMAGFAASAPEYLNSVNIFSDSGVKSLVGSSREVVSTLNDSGFEAQQLISNLRNAFSSFSGGVVKGASIIFGGIFSFILIVVISFYLAVQDKGIENFLRGVTPLKYEPYITNLWQRAQTKIGLWMQGQLLLGLFIGVLVYLGLSIMGIPYALLLAVIAAIFELIPLFGPIISAVPPVILGFSHGGLALGLMVIGFYIIIQQFENHLIYPLIVRKIIGVPPILVILSLIICAKLFGFLGLILAVPFVSVLLEIFDDFEKKKKQTVGKMPA